MGFNSGFKGLNVPYFGFCDPEFYLFSFSDDRPFLFLRQQTELDFCNYFCV